MEARLKQPCNDCPFRRVAAPGWLGGGTPEEFVRGALSDTRLPADERDYARYVDGDTIVALPCHLTVDYDNPEWRATLESADVCVGALQFAANNCKSPRDPEKAALVSAAGRSDDVFAHHSEFIAHHTMEGAAA